MDVFKTKPIGTKAQREARLKLNHFEKKHNLGESPNMSGYEFRDTNGQTLDEANDEFRIKNGRAKNPLRDAKLGPVQNRNYEDLETEVERQAFMAEARSAAESIARGFKSNQKSFANHVATMLFQMTLGN